MKPDHECIVTGGGTSSDGELRIWQDLNPHERGHFLFRDQKAKSVYTMTISPSGKYLATGSKVGLVRIWPFLDQSLSEQAPYLFEIYHQLCPVTSLAFLTDDLVLSGGANGKIRVISISQGKHLKDLDAHSGSICSLVALGSRVVASLGIDGKLKIWDMDSLTCEYQKEGFLFPKDSFSLFPTLAFAEEAGYLCCPSANGKLHLFDLHNACSHETLQAHQGAFYGITACGKYLVTGGIGDCKLKLLNLIDKKRISELEVGTSFLRLRFVGKEKVAAVCNDPAQNQSLRLFVLPDLKASGAIGGLDLRSLATLPPPVVEHRKNVELMHLKNNFIEKAKSKIKYPKEMEPFLKQLTEKGFWVEAKLLQAESAKVRKKPLHELGFLLQLTSAIRMSQSTVSIFRYLASLLEQLNEPELAIQYYERLKPFSEEAELPFHRLEGHPLLGLDPKMTVRSDISQVQMAIQEMEKDTVLERPFVWRLTLPSTKPRVFMVQALNNVDLWDERFRASLKGRSAETGQEAVILFDGQNTRKLNWLRISKIGIHSPSPYLYYAIEIDHKNEQAQGYGIFNPNKEKVSTENLANHNASLAIAYRSICQQKQREIENWLNLVHEYMKKVEKHNFSRRK